MPTYTHADLKTAVSEGLHGKGDNLIDYDALLRRGVRELSAKVDMKSQQRKMAIAPGLYSTVYEYMAPVDMKGDAVVDISRQIKRSEEFNLFSNEEFDRRKTYDKGMIAFSNHDGVKILRLSTEMNTTEIMIDDFESLTANGTFVASGDASNMSIDTSNYLNGGASLKFDTASGGTTAVITNSTMESIDLTNFKGQSIFLYVYIPAVTNLTNFILKWGSSASAYWSATVTTTHEGLTFQVGWNLLRFDFPATTTGTPDITEVNYLQITITKAGAMAATTGWRLDFAVARLGDIHYITYYSKYNWQTTGTLAYKEIQTASTDYLVADEEEFDLFVGYCVDIAGVPCRLNAQERKENRQAIADSIARYRQLNPSERKLFLTTYHRSASIDGDNDVNNLIGWNNRLY